MRGESGGEEGVEGGGLESERMGEVEDEKRGGRAKQNKSVCAMETEREQ